MDRRSPLRALFTVLAFVLATIAPDRGAAREHDAPIVESHAVSATAVPAVWTFSVHSAARAGAPRNTHSPQPGLPPTAATIGQSGRPAGLGRETQGLREPDPHAFTYDATAPPSIVAR